MFKRTLTALVTLFAISSTASAGLQWDPNPIRVQAVDARGVTAEDAEFWADTGAYLRAEVDCLDRGYLAPFELDREVFVIDDRPFRGHVEVVLTYTCQG